MPGAQSLNRQRISEPPPASGLLILRTWSLVIKAACWVGGSWTPRGPFPAPVATTEHCGHSPPPRDQPQHCSPRQGKARKQNTHLCLGVVKAAALSPSQGKGAGPAGSRGVVQDLRSCPCLPVSLHCPGAQLPPEASSFQPGVTNSTPFQIRNPRYQQRWHFAPGRVIQGFASFCTTQVPSPPGCHVFRRT